MSYAIKHDIETGGSNIFVDIVSQRYQKGTILITTTKGIEVWPEILAGDDVLATGSSIGCSVIATCSTSRGRSYRLRDLPHR